MRIDRFLSKTLHLSRKEVRGLLRANRVAVNGEVVTVAGTIIDEFNDRVLFDDELLVYEAFYYYLINKPQGYVCASKDSINPTIIDYNPLFSAKKLHTVGRLDKDTTGVLILTNHGEITHKLISPKSKIVKSYLVETAEFIPEKLVDIFANGFRLDDEFTTLPAKLEIIDNYKARLSIYEGKYHQVKRMFKAFDITVIKLHREQFGTLRVDDLKLGEFKKLNFSDIEKLIKD